jgi:hypothetical protein
MINLIRRAELDYLSPKIGKKIKKSAEATLFGMKGSLLPEVCEAMGINLYAARLILIQWKVEGKVGDPLFAWMQSPKALLNVGKGIPMDVPNFETLRCNNAGLNKGGQGGSDKGTVRNRQFAARGEVINRAG